MSEQPVLPQWLIEAGEQMAETFIPLQHMPGVPGPVRVSLLGLVATAYLEGWKAASVTGGVPPGSRVLSAEEWALLGSILRNEPQAATSEVPTPARRTPQLRRPSRHVLP